MANRNNLYKLDMLILSILAKHDCYGYQLTQIMKRASGGIIKSQVSSLYPILYRMINEGSITNYETTIKQNRRRVYYHLEPEGFHQLDQMLKEYQQVIGGIQSILDYSGDVYQKEGKDKR